MENENKEPRGITGVYREVMGQGLQRMREEKGISRYKIAKETGLSFATIKNVEEGARPYEIDTLLLYIRAADLYLFFGDKTGKELTERSIEIE